MEGDDVTEAVDKLISRGERFESLMTGKALADLGLDPICAQAYVGGLGIAEALRQGAQIVICGRVADAAPASKSTALTTVEWGLFDGWLTNSKLLTSNFANP